MTIAFAEYGLVYYYYLLYNISDIYSDYVIGKLW